MSSNILRYRGDIELTVGQPLGCDSTDWPYKVEAVIKSSAVTEVHLEPWPIPGPGASEQEMLEYKAAMRYTQARLQTIRG